MKKIMSVECVDPADFYELADSNLLDLLSWVISDANMLRRTKSLPELESYARGLDPLGVAASNRHPESPFKRKDWFLIHWPTVFRCIDEMFERQQYGMVAVLWHFREVLRRRSVVYHDLLRRKIAQQLTYRYFPMKEDDKRRRGYQDLSPIEEEVFNGLAMGVMKKDRTIDALSESFKNTLVPRGSDPKLRYNIFAPQPVREDIFKSVGPYRPADCTIFSAVELKKNQYRLKAHRNISAVSGEGFGPAKLNDDFNELFYAFHFRRTDFGVARLSEHVIAIDLLKYIPYRTQLTNYYRTRVNAEERRSKALTASRMLSYFESIFEPIIVHGAASVYRRRIEKLWGDDSIEFVLFLSVEGLSRRMAQANRMEAVRKYKKRSGGSLPTGPKTPRIHVLETPALLERGSETMRFEVIRRPSGLFWGVPWDISSTLHYDLPNVGDISLYAKSAPLPRKTTMKKGVTYVEAYDRYFYSFDFLVECRELPDNPVIHCGELRDWMKTLSDMPARQFNLLQAGVRKDLVVQQRRKPGSTLRGVSWTKEEDDAIKELYRPNMSERDEARLLSICRGRKMRAVMRRATQLRKEMVADGIYDLDSLPHRNFNASLLKLVKDAKTKAEKRIKERTVKL